MCLFPFFSFRRADKVIYHDDLPAYRPIDQEPSPPSTTRSYKYTFDIPSPGTMNITARNDGTLIFHHIPTAKTGFSHGGVTGGFDGGDNVTGLSAEARQEKLDQTKLRLQEARAKFQESMDRLNQELTLVRDDDSATLLDNEDAGSSIRDEIPFEDNDCKELVKI
ncbi:hypothetical protein EAE96_010955 [Botrytis aclada]|nr:hypothetical protein EAE96_010955 [Botrytis aclada]